MSQSAISEADQALCLAVFKQIDVGSIKVDYKILQEDLNLNSLITAKGRWNTFKKKINGGTPTKNGPETPTKPKGTPKVKNTPTSKKRKMNGNEGDDTGIGNAGEGGKGIEVDGGGGVENEQEGKGEDVRVNGSGHGSTPNLGYYEDLEEEI